MPHQVEEDEELEPFQADESLMPPAPIKQAPPMEEPPRETLRDIFGEVAPSPPMEEPPRETLRDVFRMGEEEAPPEDDPRQDTEKLISEVDALIKSMDLDRPETIPAPQDVIEEEAPLLPIEEPIEEPVEEMTLTETLDVARNKFPQLEGDESYKAVMKLRNDVMRAALLGNPTLGNAYFSGSQEDQEYMMAAIHQRVNEEYPDILKEFTVASTATTDAPRAWVDWEPSHQPFSKTAETPRGWGDWEPSPPPPPRTITTPARTAPILDHGMELNYQALLDGNLQWWDLPSAQFMQMAELYADRHPDYKNSEYFKEIKARAVDMRKKMGASLSEEGRLSWDVDNVQSMKIVEGVRAALPLPENWLIDDEEEAVRNVTRVLYHLEGEDLGTPKAIGLMGGMLLGYGAAYRELAKRGLLQLMGQGAKPVKAVAAMTAAESLINFGWNEEGHSLISNIFMEGEPNVPLSYAEAIAIGITFQLAYETLKPLTAMPRREVAGYLENKIPTMEGARGNLLSVLDQRSKGVTLGEIVEHRRMVGLMGERHPGQLALPGPAFQPTPEILGPQVARTGEVASERVAAEIERSGERTVWLKRRAKELREQARLYLDAGEGDPLFSGASRKAEGKALARQSTEIEKRLAASGSRETAELSKTLAEGGVSGKEIIALGRELGQHADDAMADQARIEARIRASQPEVRAVDDLMMELPEGGRFTLTDREIEQLRESIAKIRKTAPGRLTTLPPEAIKKGRKLLNPYTKIMEMGETLETFSERVNALQAAREATKGAKGGLTDAEAMGFADIARKEMFKFPRIAFDLSLRTGFGNLTGQLAEEKDLGYWNGFLMGFVLFNPQFTRIRGGKLGIKTGGKEQAFINKWIEPLVAAMERIHPAAGKSLPNFETRNGWLGAEYANEQGQFWKELFKGVKKKILTKEEVADFAEHINDTGTALPNMRKIRGFSERLAESKYSAISSDTELFLWFKEGYKRREKLIKELEDLRGEPIGRIKNHYPRSVINNRIDDYNKLMGLDEEDLISEAVREWEKSNYKLYASRAEDAQIIKAIASDTIKGGGGGLRAAGTTGFTKQRKFERIMPEAKGMYHHPAISGEQFVKELVYEIEKLRFLGGNLSDVKAGKYVFPKHRKGTTKKPLKQVDLELDQSFAGLLAKLRPDEPMLPAGTEIRTGTASTGINVRVLDVDTPFYKTYIGELDNLSRAEGKRLREIAEDNRGLSNKISASDRDMLVHLAQQRFLKGNQVMPAWFHIQRSLTHFLNLGQHSSAVTQGGDMGLITLTEGLETSALIFKEQSQSFVQDVLKAVTKGKYNKARPDNILFAKEQFGLGDFGAEFFGMGQHGSKWVDYPEKWASGLLQFTGLRALDKLFRNTKINATLYNMFKDVKGHVTKDGKVVVTKISDDFRKRFEANFGDDFNDLVEAVVRKDLGDWNLRTALMMELGRVQPIFMSNLPTGYITGAPWQRAAYVLKTFQVMFVNYLRQTALAKMYHGGKDAIRPSSSAATRMKGVKQISEGVGHLVRMGVYFGGATFATNTIKDFMKGRPFEPTNAAKDAMLQVLGVSRWEVYRTQRRYQREGGGFKGVIFGAGEVIMPAAVSTLDDFRSDLWDISVEDKPALQAESLKRVPVVGGYLYETVGAGGTRRSEREDKEMKGAHESLRKKY